MASVTIGHEFFAKEARNYRDMKFAFWRELFQNSVDAGARRIQIDVDDTDNGVRVTFADNGSGMSKDTLENVFFSLGSTTKTTGNIGGYGKARIILCFAQQEYFIRTRNMNVTGSAGEYEIDDTQPYFNGCVFSVLMNPNLFYGGITKDSIVTSLKRFLRLSQLSNIVIVINGETYNDDWMYRRNAVRQLSFGVVYHNKSRNHPNVVIRVSGVPMFENYVGGEFGQVVVELIPEKSRDVLTSNRDGLTYESNEELSKFLAEVTVDKKKALRTRNHTKTTFKGGARRFFKRVEQIKNSFTGTPPDGGVSIPGIRVSSSAVASVAAAEGNNVAGNATVCTTGTCPVVPSIDPLIAGLILLNRATSDTIVKAAYFYDPRNWKKDSAGRRKKVLEQWIIAVESALGTLCEQQNISEIDYRVGWYFDDEDLACHQTQDDGSHALLLNPVYTSGVKYGKMKYGLRSMESHVELISYACHEVAHILYEEHDAGFARVYTHLVTETMKSMDEIHKSMINILGRENKE